MNVTVIGAGLAGCEAAWQLAQRGVQVTLHEMKPQKRTDAHKTDQFAELCCSNSLRSDQLENAVGLLKEEMRRLGSLIIACADETRVEAGGALAVDRHGFAARVTEKVRTHPNITVLGGEVTEIPAEGSVTLLYGPLKPRGLKDPKTGREPYAVVQLRKDNADGSIYNLVGFQTHLRFGEQKRVFSMIPALHDAEFVRYGVMHRNTYLNSPGLLDRYYRLLADERIAFAGQMTGVEGYVESAASGMLAGIELARRLRGEKPVDFPMETAIGALGLYVSNTTIADFQPMNVNFGIMPPLGRRVKGGKRVKNAALAERSLEVIDALREDVLSDIEA